MNDSKINLESQKAYLTTNVQNVRDSPKQIIDKAVPNKPNKRIGLRPIWSEALLHCRIVIASVM